MLPQYPQELIIAQPQSCLKCSRFDTKSGKNKRQAAIDLSNQNFHQKRGTAWDLLQSLKYKHAKLRAEPTCSHFPGVLVCQANPCPKINTATSTSSTVSKHHQVAKFQQHQPTHHVQESKNSRLTKFSAKILHGFSPMLHSDASLRCFALQPQPLFLAVSYIFSSFPGYLFPSPFLRRQTLKTCGFPPSLSPSRSAR